MQTPQNIRVLKDERIVELVWSETDVSRLPFRAIRLNCRCAACVDEFTGRKILMPETVSEDIHPDEVSLTGNYAMKFRWSDTHDSGLFTFDHLRSLATQLEQAASEN